MIPQCKFYNRAVKIADSMTHCYLQVLLYITFLYYYSDITNYLNENLILSIFSDLFFSVVADSIIKLFELHPETVFHCKKSILAYLNQLKNYSVSEKCFTHLVRNSFF